MPGRDAVAGPHILEKPQPFLDVPGVHAHKQCLEHNITAITTTRSAVTPPLPMWWPPTAPPSPPQRWPRRPLSTSPTVKHLPLHGPHTQLAFDFATKLAPRLTLQALALPVLAVANHPHRPRHDRGGGTCVLRLFQRAGGIWDLFWRSLTPLDT